MSMGYELKVEEGAKSSGKTPVDFRTSYSMSPYMHPNGLSKKEETISIAHTIQ